MMLFHYSFRKVSQSAYIFMSLIVFFIALTDLSHADETPVPSAKQVIKDFYRSYLAAKPSQHPVTLHPVFSTSFQKLIDKDAAVCQKGDICAWPGEADPYLDAQELSSELTYENSKIKVTEPKPGVVEVKFNIDPNHQDAANDRTIRYLMVRENHQWVVDNIISGSWSVRQEIKREINVPETRDVPSQIHK
jgi:hypothetical protein